MGASQTISDMAVIGAGPTGIAAVKELAKCGLDVTCFEKGSGLASAWQSPTQNPSAPTYNSLRLNNSAGRMRYSERPIVGAANSYVTASQFHSYLKAFVDEFQLLKHFRFNMHVVRIERLDERWYLHFSDDQVHRCENLLIATGMCAQPRVPTLFNSFTGTLKHSSEYVDSEPFCSARVLVVGSGNSGAEIASELVSTAASVDLAINQPTYIVPRTIGGFAYDRLDGPLISRLPLKVRQAVYDLMLHTAYRRASAAGLPTPPAKLLASPWTISSQLVHRIQHGDVKVRSSVMSCEGSHVLFKDGHKAKYDAIIAATGYTPWFPESTTSLPVSRSANECYLKIVPPQTELSNLYLLGCVVPLGPILPVAEAQARWVSSVLIGATSKPSVEKMRQIIDHDKEVATVRFSASSTPTILVDTYHYIRCLEQTTSKRT
jgi:hypothetical protein